MNYQIKIIQCCQSAFHSTSQRRQALMLATGGKQFRFDTSKQNSVSAIVSPMGQMPKLHRILSNSLTFLFAIMSFPTFFQALQPVVGVQTLLLSEGLRQEILSRIPSWCKMGARQTHPQPREQNILTAAFPACSHSAPNTRASKHAGTGR